MKNANPTILLIEDNEDDVFAMQRALKRTTITNPLQVVTDGQQALDYLSGTERYTDRAAYPLPFLVFLDLKLPYIDGFEILAWMRQQPQLQSIVVVVLTSSAENKDHERACSLGAKSYLVKPPTPAMLNGVFDSLKGLWVSHAAAQPVSIDP